MTKLIPKNAKIKNFKNHVKNLKNLWHILNFKKKTVKESLNDKIQKKNIS